MEDTPKKEPLLQAHIANADDIEKIFPVLQRLQGDGLSGKWQAFPTTKNELQGTLKEIGVDGLNGRLYFINNYKSYSEHLNNRLPVGAGIDEINYLAVKLNEMSEYNREVFDAVMCSGKGCSSMTEIIQTAENINAYDLQPVTSAWSYGEFLIESSRNDYASSFERLSQSENSADKAFAQYIEQLEQFVDFASYGRNQQQLENGIFTDRGYLTQDGELTSLYQGNEDIPAEYSVFAFPESEPTQKTSVLGRLATAKDEAAKNDNKPDKNIKSNNHEL